MRRTAMKLMMLLLPALLAATGARAAAGADALDRYDELLARYVTPAGVRYDAWRADAGDARALSSLVATLAATDPAALAPADRFALYINLYNAKMIELVLREDPPRSVRNISIAWGGFGVFYKKYLEFDGERISLNRLEKRLRTESNDPRIHFAVNCASRSCPPLAAEAYRGARLDGQLARATREFLAAPGALALEEGRLRVSKIFDWYAGDFAPAGGVRAFLAEHAPREIATRLAGGERLRIVYHDYDWSLNRAP